MSIELITGRAGKPHVDSQDVRAYQAYTAGSGRYVLHGAACSIESANEASITPGEILVDGAHVRVTGDGESVTLVNGQTGYKRVDIVALHYTVTGSGEDIVEHMEFTVVQGSPSDTDPADPDMPQSGSILDGVTETYVPFARVVIDGLSPQDPVMLVEQYALPSDMGGIPSGGDLGSFLAKASATDYDTGWKTVEETLEALGLNGIGEVLWNGRITEGGKLTIPDANRYGVMAVSYTGNGPVGLAMHYINTAGTHIISGMAGSSESSGILMRGLLFISDDGVTWTAHDLEILSIWGSGTTINAQWGNETSSNTLTIWGIIPSQVTQRVLSPQQ